MNMESKRQKEINETKQAFLDEFHEFLDKYRLYANLSIEEEAYTHDHYPIIELLPKRGNNFEVVSFNITSGDL